MSAKERTYSFRASGDLDERLRRAQEQLAKLSENDDTEFVDAVAHHIHRTFLRSVARLRENATDSELIRAAVEGLVSATERAAAEAELIDEYRAWAREDREGEAFRRAALEAAAEIWRD